ncbi:indole-3-glycerol phosphate synthase TrpC [Acetonema longum]|uniref:indole-3-glycerol-phosphate synthase n=1 Tax=Acetonema longum DSM 6540 TaxID=1009370 RepID=F7NDP9_9FIRM|nr:indole-3-glycerol phosphate synthase TrpC [Acetonema longum]EGO65818.1 indole-3-glycerol phosphate synthase [Acetonema longum DSM 6540]
MLTQIVADIRRQVAETKALAPLAQFRREIQPGQFLFSQAIKTTDWALIAECKLMSPAKGVLVQGVTVPELAQIYSQNGASCLSVHTSRPFGGSIQDIGRVKAVSQLPVLCKDFMIDPYQIYQARWAGADAVLLIAAILSDLQLQQYQAIAGELGLDCLVEIHSLEELERARTAGAHLVGINNRDLKTFTTDVARTYELLPYCGKECLVISESGIAGPEEVEQLQRSGVRGALVGEGLVKAPDIAGRTRQLARVVVPL